MSAILAQDLIVSYLESGNNSLVIDEDGKHRVYVTSTMTLPEVAEYIRTSDTLKLRTGELRAVLAEAGRDGQYSKDKGRMPSIIPTSLAPAETPVKSLAVVWHNGLYGYDVDDGLDPEDRPEVKRALIESPGAAMVADSCSGDLWVLYAGPVATSALEYKYYWQAIADLMPAKAKAANGKTSNNLNRLRHLACDPESWLAAEIEALDLPQGATKKAGPGKTTSKGKNRQSGQASADVRPTPDVWQARCPTLVLRSTQLEGPCPECGGDDRFHVNLEAPYLFGCRKCGDNSMKPLWAAFPEPRAASGGARPGAGRPEDLGSERSTRRGRESQGELDSLSASELIGQISDSKSVIHWLDKFWQKRDGGPWVAQDDIHFRKLMRKHILERRETDLQTISNVTMSTYIQSLKDEVAPPCTDAFLLNPLNRTLNYDLDTGKLLPGASFNNVTVSITDGELKIAEHQLRDFFSAVRPYDFPETKRDRPALFDLWLEERLPDPEARQCVWELLGGVVLKLLHEDEAIGAFCGPGGTGKGVAIGVAEMLAGEANVMAVAGGPPRLATSQFALSPLGEGCDLLTMADIPQAPGRWEHAAVARAEWQKGSTLLKTISGSGRIQVETKGKPQKSMKPRVSVLADSNFEWDWMRTDSEADSWYRRVVFVPFNEQIPEGETIPNYIERFEPEIPQIAWFAAQAFLEKRLRGSFTWSQEMRAYQAKVFKGVGAGKGLEPFLELLVADPTARFISRAEVLEAATAYTGAPVSRAVAKRIYNYAEGLPGVTPLKNQVLGFIGLRVESRA